MKLKTLDDLLLDQLKDLHSAENQIAKALPKMAKRAECESLAQAFTDHLEETKVQLGRLEKISKLLGKALTGKKCKAAEGLLAEGSEIMEEDGEGCVIDAGLIAAAQRVEHYEISAYGAARAMAEQVGQQKIAALLAETLAEEAAADEKLTELAMDDVYPAIRGLTEQADDDRPERTGEGRRKPARAVSTNGRAGGVRGRTVHA